METVSESGSSVTVALLLGLVVVILAYLRFKSTSSKKLAPGPRGLDALRGMVSALREGSLNRQAEQWSRQYGPLVLCRSAVGDLCVLNSPRLVREMFASRETEHLTNNRPRCFVGWFALYDFRDVIVSSPQYRPEWPKMRKMFHQAIKFYGDGVERMESKVMEELRRLTTELEADCGQDVDMDHVISTSAMRIVLTLVTGECPDPEVAARAKLLNDLTNEMFSPITDTLLTAFPWLRHLPLLPYRKLCRDVITTRDCLMHDLFTEPKATHVRGQPRGIVDVLLDEQEKEENQWMTDDHIRGLVLNIIAAAVSTSTQTLKALFLYLTHNPEVARKLQDEIDSKIGKRTPRLQDMSDLPYAEAVTWETLRLASPASMGLPHLTTDDVTVDGYIVPKGATVFANILGFHHDPEIFSDPEAFHPERFLDDEGQMLPANDPLRQSMIAFGVGKRSCVGESFARSRVFLYVTTLLQQFDVLPPTQHELLPVTRSSWKNGIVLELKPYHAVFRPREHTQHVTPHRSTQS
ncbi:farnesoate epoxidase-like [Littorina saxatilis]|uniref:Cytochrome P450 n=1 Tax=Littorina saxatilis TaxID=31220 RepID=A0AAN9GPZ6_9CAEN